MHQNQGVKMVKDKERILKGGRGKQHATHKKYSRVTANLSWETMKAKRQWDEVFTRLK